MERLIPKKEFTINNTKKQHEFIPYNLRSITEIPLSCTKIRGRRSFQIRQRILEWQDGIAQHTTNDEGRNGKQYIQRTVQNKRNHKPETSSTAGDAVNKRKESSKTAKI